ncbi:MAG: YHS domain-containing (seleno)protein [Myxococcota bacterium]
MKETRSIIIGAVLSLSAGLVGCASQGQCLGSAAAGRPSTEKVLLNLDRNGVAIQGYDPVAYFTDGKPVKGRPEIRSMHRGAIYWFASSEHKEAFDEAPDKYAPQFGGWCAYAASINALSPIGPEYWQIVDGRLVLNHNEKAERLWKRDVEDNLAKADRNWPGLVERNGTPPRTLVNVDDAGLALQGYDPTSYFIDGKPLRGDPSLFRTYQGATYYFVDKAHKDAFEKEPAKYVPAFGGFCGYAASINKLSPIDPEVWQIIDDRLVLQHTEKAYQLFNEDSEASYAKAQQNWPGLMHQRCS